MAINLDRKSPGVVGIFFGGVLSIALGALLAVCSLVAQPVEVVRALPKEPAPGVRYFIQGATNSETKVWERKVDQLENGRGEVGLSEADLNAWSTVTFAEMKLTAEEKDSPFLIVAGRPNFHFVGRELQVGTINKIISFGSERPLVLQARGGFVQVGGKWTYQTVEAYLGGFPLHRVPALAGKVASRLGVQNVPATVEKILANATQLAVAEDELVVRMP